MTRFSHADGRTRRERERLAWLILLVVALLGLVNCQATSDPAEGAPEERAPLALDASTSDVGDGVGDGDGATEWKVSVDVSEGRGTFLQTLLLDGDREVGLTDGTTRRVDELAPADAIRLERGLMGVVTETHPLPPRADAAAKPSAGTRRVIATIRRVAEVLVTIRTAHGEVVTTPEHPFWKSGVGWTEAQDLAVGDAIITAQSGSAVRVASTETSRVPPTPVYNLTIEGSHTYYVGPEALLVHNMDGCGAPASSTEPSAGEGGPTRGTPNPETVDRTGAPTEVRTNRTSEWPYHHPPERYELRPGEPVPKLDPSKGTYLWQVNEDGTVVIAPESQPGFGVTERRPNGRSVKHGDLNPSPDGQSRGVNRAGGELRPVLGADGNWTWIMDNNSSNTFQRADGTRSTPENLKAAKQLMEEAGLDTSGFTLITYNGQQVPGS